MKNLNKITTILLMLYSLSGLSQTQIGYASPPFSTQTQWENYFKNRIKDLDPIEGIWSKSSTFTYYHGGVFIDKVTDSQTGKIAIYKERNAYKTYAYDINNRTLFTFQNIASSGIYLCELRYPSGIIVKSNAILTGNGLLEFSYEKPVRQIQIDGDVINVMAWHLVRGIYEQQWIKLSPKAQDYIQSQPSSGTGFAISLNGIIVTNYHIVDGASRIKVRGVNSDFYRTYSAKVLVSDKNNDLALIQIDDYNFYMRGTIPYVIKTGVTNVGENIFVLGYPLKSTMGEEIKLTNGIISSRTGFQGDVTSYQISAPIQPGNSGCPLFNNQGNLVGVINAKHAGAENVSYAIKTGYLANLIELLPYPPKLQTVNLLAGKTLSQQVELVKNFIYIIEVE
jgi:S1-C subfamily serine protease